MSWNLLGHDQAIRLLQNHLIQEDSRHAYLFTGFSGIGRRSFALQFAQALNCLNPPAPAEFCGACRICRQIAQQQHPDLFTVAAETVGGTLKIDAIRDLQRSLYLAPYEAKWRVALILRFEEANIAAQNALLKTLEEPPEHVKLLLTATTENALLPTITSRCEIVRLKPMGVDALAETLIAHGNETDAARKIAHLSAGRQGVALQLFDDPARANGLISCACEALELFDQNTREKFTFAATFRDIKKRAELREVLFVWQSLFRDLLLLSIGAENGVFPLTFTEIRAEMEDIARRYSTQEWISLMENLNETMDQLNANVNPQLILEHFFLSFPK